jgi:alkyldihydroxyacetonephosphate synthase
MCHVSHIYPTGASLYFTVAGRQMAPDGAAGGDGSVAALAAGTIAAWTAAKTAATDAMVAAGATITHHHAVGRDHRPWLAAEIGPLGLDVLRAVKAALDPAGILNPGILV